MAIIKLVPTLLELKNLPSDIISVALGVPALVVSFGLILINKLEKSM